MIRVNERINLRLEGEGVATRPAFTSQGSYSSKPEWDYDSLDWNPSTTQMARFKARDLELAKRNVRTLGKHHPRSSPYQDTLHSLATVKAATFQWETVQDTRSIQAIKALYEKRSIYSPLYLDAGDIALIEDK